jgi:hypothetical protein
MIDTTHVDIKNLASPSFFKIIEGLSVLRKHTLRVDYLFGGIDAQRLIYPKGVIGSLKEEEIESKRLRRIELFAGEETGDTYGIIRNLFVAHSSELSLLDLAMTSNGVISVRAFPRSSIGSKSDEIKEDKLILKSTDSTTLAIPNRARAPSLFVSQRWLDKMNLAKGDRIIVSNPIENFVVPPPNMAEALKP